MIDPNTITVTFLQLPWLEPVPKMDWLIVRLGRYLIEQQGRPPLEHIVREGRRTDLASVPRVPLAYMLCGGRAPIAAVLHDDLYNEHKREREWCDAVFLAAMRNEEPGWRASLMHAGVRLGGWVPFYGRSAPAVTTDDGE